MKKTVLIILILKCLNIKAQYSMCMCEKDSTKNKFSYQNQTGINSTNYFRYGFSNNAINGIQYKRQFKSLWLRTGFNHTIATYNEMNETELFGSNDAGQLKFSDVRLGIQKDLFKNAFSPYVFVDLLVSKGNYNGKAANWGGFRGTYLSWDYEKQSKIIGINSGFGVKYKFLNRWSTQIETGFNFAYYETINKNITNNTTENKKGFYLSALTNGNIGLNFHF